jgi:transposase-like protein
MSARAVPFFCPYCGEESLVPDIPQGATGEGHGHWACRSCQRSFRLNLTALASATTVTTPHAEQTRDRAPEENS